MVFASSSRRYKIRPPVNLYTGASGAEIVKQTTQKGDKSYFKLKYKNKENKNKEFVFELLPEIDSAFSANKGLKNPEGTPGIVISNKIRRSTRVVPGATPITQTIGVEKVSILLGGLLGGSEVSRDPSSTAIDLFEDGNGDTYKAAIALNNDIVLTGKPVTLEIYGGSHQIAYLVSSGQVRGSTENGLKITLQITIDNIRTYTYKQNRTFYTLEGTILFETNTDFKPIVISERTANSNFNSGGNSILISNTEIYIQSLKNSAESLITDGSFEEFKRASEYYKYIIKADETLKTADTILIGNTPTLMSKELIKLELDRAEKYYILLNNRNLTKEQEKTFYDSLFNDSSQSNPASQTPKR